MSPFISRSAGRGPVLLWDQETPEFLLEYAATPRLVKDITNAQCLGQERSINGSMIDSGVVVVGNMVGFGSIYKRLYL